jgi:outer membrane protein
MKSHQKINVALLPLVLLSSGLLAQSPPLALPNAPGPSSLLVASSQPPSTALPQPHADGTETPTLLTRQEAERIALANNPRIHISQLIARVQHQVVRERRADQLPNVNGSVTAVEANDGSRISSGALTASTLLNHAGAGVQVSQLITDFGRTSNLISSAKLQEKARLADAEASREDIVLLTDQVFFGVIEAQETLKVAAQTVSARQALTDQVSALASSSRRRNCCDSTHRTISMLRRLRCAPCWVTTS